MVAPLSYSDGAILHGADMNQIIALIMSRPTLWQTSGIPQGAAPIGTDGDLAIDPAGGKLFSRAGGSYTSSGLFVPAGATAGVMPAVAGDSNLVMLQNGVLHYLDAIGFKNAILSGVSSGGGGVTVTGGRTFRDLRDYNPATDGSDVGVKVNQALADLKTAGPGGALFIPFRASGYNISQSIDLSIFSGLTAPAIICEEGTVFNQVGANPVFKAIGVSSATNGGSPSGFIFNFVLVNANINTSGSEYQADGITPARVLDFRCCYQLYLENVNINGGITQHFFFQEVWDSFLTRCSFTGGGHCNPFQSAGSNGRAVIAALETRCGFTIGVPCCEIWSPDTLAGQDNSNNIRFEDCRWETSPLSAVMLLVHGKDGVRFSFRGCKMETRESVRPVLAMFDQAAIDLGDLWLMGDGNGAVPDWAPADCGTKGVAYRTSGTAPAVAWFDNCFGITGHNIGGGSLGTANWDSWIRFNLSSGGSNFSGIFSLFMVAVLPINITGGSLVKDTGGAAPGSVRGSQPPWFTPTIPVFYSNSIPTELSGTAAPTTGTYARGSRIWFTTPSAAGAPGAVCVSAGSPGIWKNMASLSA